jgi:uncharacterized protein (DUF433 family)
MVEDAGNVTQTPLRTRLYRDDKGHVWIEGANTRVIQIAMDRYAHGWSADEIQAQHPHLSLAQIHAALSDYYDHKTEMDAEMERGDPGGRGTARPDGTFESRRTPAATRALAVSVAAIW